MGWRPVTERPSRPVQARRRMLAAIRRLARRRADAEWERRALAGMPRRHPESLTRPLSRRHERLLARLQAGEWPAREYLAVVDLYHEGGNA
jgi:hypothetical protein